MSDVHDVAGHFADQVVLLREQHVQKFRESSGGNDGISPTMGVVGGFVKSYQFTCVQKDKDIFDGTVWINFGKTVYEVPASFLLLREQRASSEKADKIVEQTSLLSCSHDAVLEAYFATYCQKMKRWIVAYERFSRLLVTEITSNPCSIPAFFEGPNKLKLTDYWRKTVRSFIEILALAKKEGIVMGGRSDASNYAITTSGIKIFCVARHSNVLADDISDLRTLFSTNPFFLGSSSQEWQGFDFLLGSTLMSHDQAEWKPIVLNHPILLDAPTTILRGYEDIHVWSWNISAVDRKKFANAWAIKMPITNGESHVKDFYNVTSNFSLEELSVYKLVQSVANEHSFLHLAIAQFVRNLIRHGGDDPNILEWDDSIKLENVRRLFGGLMSMGYSLRWVPETDRDAVCRTRRNIYH